MIHFSLAISTFIWVLVFLPTPQHHYVIKGGAQGTSYTIQYYATKEIISKASVDSIFREIDASMSLYQPSSLINQFNNGDEVIMDAHFQQVLQQAFLIHKETEGVFDATVGPLSQLWGFGVNKEVETPNKRAVADAKKRVGMQFLEVQGNKLLKKKAGVQLDLNGIAQGYTVDLLSAYLIKRDISSFIVELGGEIYAHGKKPDGTTFKVAVERPSMLPGEPIVICLEETAMTTSANYDEKKHLINPKTGYPLTSDILSVTVSAPTALVADGYDNALIGMGLNKALKWLQGNPHLAAYFVYRDAAGLVRDTATISFKSKILNNKNLNQTKAYVEKRFFKK